MRGLYLRSSWGFGRHSSVWARFIDNGFYLGLSCCVVWQPRRVIWTAGVWNEWLGPLRPEYFSIHCISFKLYKNFLKFKCCAPWIPASMIFTHPSIACSFTFHTPLFYSKYAIYRAHVTFLFPFNLAHLYSSNFIGTKICYPPLAEFLRHRCTRPSTTQEDAWGTSVF